MISIEQHIYDLTVDFHSAHVLSPKRHVEAAVVTVTRKIKKTRLPPPSLACSDEIERNALEGRVKSLS
jgi:hypothetical protein